LNIHKLPGLNSPPLQPSASNPGNHGHIAKISEEFESLFLNMVFKSMRATVPREGLLDGGNAEEIYRSMLDNEYAAEMSRQRQTGLAQAIEKFIISSIPKETHASQGLQPDPKSVRIESRGLISHPDVGITHGRKTR
jgi:Rod binding domain-containing protein